MIPETDDKPPWPMPLKARAGSIVRVITGGQTGADYGALCAAYRHGIATGGFIPQGFQTEAGPNPKLGEFCGLVEHPSSDYSLRTKANLRHAHVAVLFVTEMDSPGTRLVRGAAKDLLLTDEPLEIYDLSRLDDDHVSAKLLGSFGGYAKPPDRTLFVGGNRESTSPGIGKRVEAVLGKTFGLLMKLQASEQAK